VYALWSEGQPIMQIDSVIRVVLYVAVSQEMEHQPVPASLAQKFKRSIGQALDILQWFVLRNSQMRFHHWNTSNVTNKGDIAIREAVKQQIKAAFAPRAVAFREIPWGRLSIELNDCFDAACDLFIIAGSGFIFSDEYGHVSSRMSEDAEVVKLLHCPVVAYGIGWNRLITPNDSGPSAELNDQAKSLVRALFSHVDLISGRDQATCSLVHEVTGKQVALTADPALFFEGSAGRGLGKSDRSVLHVGLNFAIHGKESAARLARQHADICNFLKAFGERHKVVYHYVQHTTTERVASLLLRAQGINAEYHDPKTEDLPALYRSLDLHICQMLHSAILSIGAGTPTMHFAYDAKGMEFFKLMRLPEFCLAEWPINFSAAEKAVGMLVEQNASVRKKIVERLAEIRADRDRFLASLSRLMNDGARN